MKLWGTCFGKRISKFTRKIGKLNINFNCDEYFVIMKIKFIEIQYLETFKNNRNWYQV
jgi:hypothetical protein